MIKLEIHAHEEVIVNKLAIYTFLQKFYDGQLNRINAMTWKDLIAFMSQELENFSNDNINKGLQLLSQFTSGDIYELEFDFNRLFVGPNRLEAPLYESSYRNKERTIMQSETLAVRRFYEKAGLVVSKKNIDPDDHLALELEFVCYLLESSLEDARYYELYQSFLEEHLFKWVDTLCEVIREKTDNPFLVGSAYLLQGFLLAEKTMIQVEGGK